MQWYARQVANNPCCVILLVLIAALSCAIVCISLNDLPDFKDPLMGFEPRGTVLSERSTAWQNLLKSTGWNGPLTFYPTSIVTDITNETLEGWSAPSTGGGNGSSAVAAEVEPGPWLELETEEHSYGSLKGAPEEEGRIIFERTSSHRDVKPSKIFIIERKNFFCNNPIREYAHVIIEPVSPSDNLFTLRGLRAICELDERLRSDPSFPELCEQSAWGACCRSWSLPNYVALLRNRSSCRELTAADARHALRLLTDCAPYYHGMKLSHECAAEPALCRAVPRRCAAHDAVYNALHYLADAGFLPAGGAAAAPKLSYTAVFLPVAQGPAAMPMYRALPPLDTPLARVTGMQFGLKHALFEECLLRDTGYVAAAAGVLFVAIWVYSSSLFVTFMTFSGVVFSLGTAYFMYTVVYQIHFFPFINLLTIVIVIGIGADDACIYCKIWACAKAEKNNGTLVKLVRDTLHHACLSMFVTSITTAVAFFASVISNITAVRCFSIFAGTAVLANFLFTVSWLPASVIMAEKWCSSWPPLSLYLPQLPLWRAHYACADYSRVFFDKILPCIVVRSRYCWIALGTAMAAAAAVAVFYYPRLRLPDAREFQIFSADHPFERYDLHLKNMFWFEKAKEQDLYRKMPIRIVWGVLPQDSGNYLDPLDRGPIAFDPTFNVARPESQRWLLQFCASLRNQSFLEASRGPLLFNCFIETFKEWMERRCVDGISDTDRTPCCESTRFPFPERVFHHCVKEAVTVLHHTPGYFVSPAAEGVRFSRTTGRVQALVVQYDSAYSYSNSHAEMAAFRDEVEAWVSGAMARAPPGMRNGWFTSDLDFLDLQESLAKGSVAAIGVALGAAFAALILTTADLRVSAFAVTSVACVIVVTVAALVLLGWQLNVTESTTVSLAIGLAVDLTLHYGVAYRVSGAEDRASGVVFALGRVGSPVAAAALSTAVAGALVLPSAVLAYRRVGAFLAVLSAASWGCATLLFLPLLAAWGPRPSPAPAAQVAQPPASYALSESTLSSSSASCPAGQLPPSESHELEPLTQLSKETVPKFKKKPRPARARSGSLSSQRGQGRAARKVSLPSVSVTFHEPTVSLGAASASTILGNDEDKEPLAKEDASEAWIRKEISV